VTWASQPLPGNVYAATDVGTAMTWYRWEVTELVEAWANETLANYGVVIIGDERVQERERAFHSRETATGYYPRLVIDYTATGDTEPPTVTVDPLPAYSPRTFTVSWSGSDEGTGIATYDVQYRVDDGPWQNWLTDVSVTSAEFTGESDRIYAFRARAVDIAGNVEDFADAEASTTVDAAAPVTTVNPLPPISDTMTFIFGWSGEDELSGIAYYDVRYRVNGSAWQLWQSQTLATSVPFTAQVDGIYQFEARAVDKVGNVEPFRGVPEASIAVDAVAPFIEPRLYLPLIRKD
jgi:hypothetical protein